MRTPRFRVRLIHWKAAEAAELVTRLSNLGFAVDYEMFSPSILHKLGEDTPDAVLIDLSRLPSAGRDVAMALRSVKATRNIPTVFVDGEREKVTRIQKQLVDAVFTSWDKIETSLRHAITNPPLEPIAPRSRLEGYSGTPLAKKLGIKAGLSVNLVNAPPSFKRTLGRLPRGLVLHSTARSLGDLTVWFAQSTKELERDIRKMANSAHNGALWIAWRKQASRIPTDLTQAAVRNIGLASGLVDHKICSIDETWSALRFTRRRSKSLHNTSQELRKFSNRTRTVLRRSNHPASE